MKTLKDYPFQTYDKIRYSDTDRQGHVNNANFAVYSETGRVEFLYNPDNPLYDEGCSFVIASNKIDLLNEITWPGTVEIGTGISRIGSSSISIEQGLYQNNILVAKTETIIVQVNNQTKKSQKLSDKNKEKLQKYTL